MLFTGVIGASTFDKAKNQGLKGSFRVYLESELIKNEQLVLDDAMRRHLGHDLAEKGYPVTIQPRNVAGGAFMPEKSGDLTKEKVTEAKEKFIRELSAPLRNKNYSNIIAAWDQLTDALRAENLMHLIGKEGDLYIEVAGLLNELKELEADDRIEDAKKTA